MKKIIGLVVMASVFGLTSCATSVSDAFNKVCVQYKKPEDIKYFYNKYKTDFDWKATEDKKTMCKTISASNLPDTILFEEYKKLQSFVHEGDTPKKLEAVNKTKASYYETCKESSLTIVDKIYAEFKKDYENVPSASDVESMCRNIKNTAYSSDLSTGYYGDYSPSNPKYTR